MTARANQLFFNKLFSTLVRRRGAWTAIGFCFLFLLYKYILQVSPSVMSAELMQHFHLSGAGLGNLAAMFFYAYVVAQFFVGPMLDKWSPRLLSSLAILLSALGVFWFSESATLVNASLARALMGVGVAFATVAYMKISLNHVKPSQFAFVAGLLATAAMVGSILGEAPLAFMIVHVGWQTSLFNIALLGLLLAILFYVCVRDGKQSLAASKEAAQALRLSDFLSVLKSQRNWLLALYAGLAFSPLAVLGGLWGNPFLEATHHLTKTESASLMSCMFLGLACGAPIIGILSGRLGGCYRMMMLGLTLSFVALMAVLYVPHLSILLTGVGLFLFGFGTGSYMLVFALGKDLNLPALAATVMALINSGDALFSAFSEPFVGKILDVVHKNAGHLGAQHFTAYDFHWALLVLPAYLFIAIGVLYRLKKLS